MAPPVAEVTVKSLSYCTDLLCAELMKISWEDQEFAYVIGGNSLLTGLLERGSTVNQLVA